ncbi:MAG: sigma-70 family RNA polymerase sigma factor [Bacteroidales bacterium]|nr:sigma-70 family RNA polymerase sigma factor [Bacteroidales bacterium]
MIHYSDEAIVEGIRLRCDYIIDYIYNEFFPVINNYVTRNSGSEEEAKDVFQDAMVIIYKKIRSDEFLLTSSFKTFLYSICKNLWLQRLNKENDNTNVDVDYLEGFLEMSEEIINDTHKLEHEKYKLFQVHFLQLSADCQKVLRLFLKKTPLKEIARIMGFKTEKYAKTRKFLCKEELKKRIVNDPKYQKIINDELYYKLKYSRLIERYMQGDMSDEEKRDFENQLDANPELEREFQLETELNKALKDEDVILFRSKVIKTIEKHHQAGKEEQPTKRMPVRTLAAAMIALLLMIGGGYFFTMSDSGSGSKLFSQYYTPDEVTFPRAANYESHLIEGFLNYQQENYNKAANLFERVLEHEKKADPSVHFYYAISSIETDNFNKAINSLEYILKDKNNLYTEHAEWNLGLCYLKKGEKVKAIDQFEDIVKTGNKFHKHKDQAKQILKKLNK